MGLGIQQKIQPCLCESFWLLLVACLTVTGCAGVANTSPALGSLEPLRVGEQHLRVDQVNHRPSSAEVLALDDDMRAFVAKYGSQKLGRRERLLSLHEALRNPAMLPITYDADANGTAAEVFHSGRANCLSYAHLFVALTRAAGLQTQYHWMDVRPRWNRLGDHLAVELHVNILIHLSAREKLVADIDPLQPWQLTGSKKLSDTDALALHHNNIAMAALIDNDLESAWVNLLDALRLNPRISFLWSNLGALYRHSGQLKAAENSYLKALQLDAANHSAMYNLALVFGELGLTAKQAYWQGRIAKYQAGNPFYHAYLGDLAAGQGDLAAAINHYSTAVALQPGNSALLYSAASVYLKIGNLHAAERFFASAMESAALASDKAVYAAKLQDVRQQRMSPGNENSEELQ